MYHKNYLLTIGIYSDMIRNNYMGQAALVCSFDFVGGAGLRTYNF